LYIQLYDAEQHIFNTSHAEVGAYLMGLWGLPDSIVAAIAFHHNPIESSTDVCSPLTALYSANILEKRENADCFDSFDVDFDVNMISNLRNNEPDESLKNIYELLIEKSNVPV
jgi:HD-like signal output (HDOD) protein